MFQQALKNFKIDFNAGNERNTFSSGDMMTGLISFDLTKETKISSITMALKGTANVNWSNRAGRGGGGRGRGEQRPRGCSAKLDFFKLKAVILQENAGGGTTKLQPGTHVYPFSCQIPQGDFPTSFCGDHGQILYALTIGIYRPWHLSKDYVTELNFVNRIDTSQPELRAPLSGSNSMTVCCLLRTLGHITMTASAEKKAFVPGESAKVICNFSNASSRKVTLNVKLQQKHIYYNQNREHKCKVFKTLVSLTGELINAHTSDVHEIMLPIPSFASLTISNCSILEVQYHIEVSLNVKGTHGITVLIPIILCDTPVYTLPPQYLVLASGSPE